MPNLDQTAPESTITAQEQPLPLQLRPPIEPLAPLPPLIDALTIITDIHLQLDLDNPNQCCMPSSVLDVNLTRAAAHLCKALCEFIDIEAAKAAVTAKLEKPAEQTKAQPCSPPNS